MKKLTIILVIFFSLQSCKKDIKETEPYQYDKVELVFANKTDTTIFYKVNENEDYFILENGIQIPKKNLNWFRTIENKNWKLNDFKKRTELAFGFLAMLMIVLMLYLLGLLSKKCW